jgi:hypothetical protein
MKVFIQNFEISKFTILLMPPIDLNVNYYFFDYFQVHLVVSQVY